MTLTTASLALLERVACTCALAPVRRVPARLCPACAAWDQNRVLLVDGTLVAKARWVDAHAPREEVRHG